MQKNLERTIGGRPGTWRWTWRNAGLAQVLAGILFLGLLLHPGRALSQGTGSPSVTLLWDQSGSLDVTGYRIYYGITSMNPTNSVGVGNVLSNTIPSLVIGATYFFTVVAYTAVGLESHFSNEFIYTVPGITAQLQIRIAANQQAILTVSGQSTHTYEIQTTPDLITWSVLGTVTLGASGSTSYTNANAGSFAKRFYRTRDTQP